MDDILILGGGIGGLTLGLSLHAGIPCRIFEFFFKQVWIASRSLSSGGALRGPVGSQ